MCKKNGEKGLVLQTSLQNIMRETVFSPYILNFDDDWWVLTVRLWLSVELLGEIGVIMGFPKHLVIDKNGSFMPVMERSYKVVNELRLGLSTMQWFAKSLVDCL